MAKSLTPSKAKEILKDDTAQGYPLTKKQKGFFGAIAGGNKAYSKAKMAIKRKVKKDAI